MAIPPTVSVIIPTTCESARAAGLMRAIGGLLDGQGVAVEVLVVANGARVDAQLLASLQSDSRLRVLRVEEGNVSVARHAGLLAARGAFFGFLDDDDEYLPAALATRLAAFEGRPEVDVVVTNGYEHERGVDRPLITLPAEELQRDLAASFLKQNWFASPAPLFRAASIDPALFAIPHRFFELSYLFFALLSKGCRFHWDAALTYRVHKDTAASASKSADFALAYPAFLESVAALPLPPALRQGLRRKYLSALNAQANAHLAAGRRGPAWRAHLKCLTHGGWAYLPYTRRLLLP